MDLGLKGRWALVCAASKGLGRGCAEALAGEGVNVVITARGEADLLATADALRAANPGVQVRTVVGDIATAEGRAAALAACPQVDILVNNAGGPPPGDFRDWGREQWLAALDANMLTPIELIKATVDGMAARGFGRIVNISSVSGQTGNFGQTNYAAAKAGLHGFSMSLARETATKGVTVNSVSPGYIETPMTLAMPEAAREKTRSAIPVGHLGQPRDIARTVAFLTADDAGYITGANIPVNGGLYMAY